MRLFVQLAAGGLAWLALAGCRPVPELSPYQREQAALEQALTPEHGELRRLDLLCRRASLTGLLPHLRAAHEAAAALPASLRKTPPVALLCARLELDLHQVDEARQCLSGAGETPGTRGLAFDLAWQTGDYTEALGMVRNQGDWENGARSATVAAFYGDSSAADRLYAEAEETLTSRQMRSYAWIELQRGQLDFRAGRLDAARAHYARANRAYPACWWIRRYEAELLGAERKEAEAVALYRQLFAETGQPELQHELGDLLAFFNHPQEAAACYQLAHDAYLDSANRGETLYLHHFVSLLADSFQDGPAALPWARREYAARPTYLARDALAWALYRSGDSTEAETEMQRVLNTGVVDAHLLFHQGMIQSALRHSVEARVAFQSVAALNPNYLTTFHAHR